MERLLWVAALLGPRALRPLPLVEAVLLILPSAATVPTMLVWRWVEVRGGH